MVGQEALRRSLTWTPCTGDDSEVVVCAAAAATETELSSTMMCLLLDPAPKQPPVFEAIADSEDTEDPECVIPEDGEWDAMMGKQLKICFRVLHHGDRSLVRFSQQRFLSLPPLLSPPCFHSSSDLFFSSTTSSSCPVALLIPPPLNLLLVPPQTPLNLNLNLPPLKLLSSSFST
jgi:hypothetical protein